jgi:eukaryotic-like serine/threonine-protein kinase
MGALVILKTVTGEQAGREFVCAGRSQFVVGRSRSCSVHLPDDPTVSRHHCLLDLERSSVRVQDLGSKNGTFINGDVIGQRDCSRGEDATQVDTASRPLRTGDELRVGHNVFVVEVYESADAATCDTRESSLILV